MGYRGGRDTTEQNHSIDIRWLRRKGYLKADSRFTLRWSRVETITGALVGSAEHHCLNLSYIRRTIGSAEWESHQHRVLFTWTRCNYGGLRPWFTCPAVGCGRRVAVLYGGRIFACRHCYHLTYQSQKEQPYDRFLRRAQTIRRKLGGSGILLEPFPAKPRGMHWRTYERLLLEGKAAEARCWPSWVLERMKARADDTD